MDVVHAELMFILSGAAWTRRVALNSCLVALGQLVLEQSPALGRELDIVSVGIVFNDGQQRVEIRLRAWTHCLGDAVHEVGERFLSRL